MLNKIEYIDTPNHLSVDPNFRRWKRKNDLYHLIQRICNQPAHFWFNYKWSIPINGEDQFLNTEDAVKQGWYLEVLREIAQGTVNPQTWCDAN